MWFIDGLTNRLIEKRGVSSPRDDILRIVEFLRALQKHRTY